MGRLERETLDQLEEIIVRHTQNWEKERMETEKKETTMPAEKENENENTGGEKKNADIDYSRLEDMINKGIQTKENGILKSYFSQLGLNEGEAKEAIETYKQNKKQKEEQALKENPQLKEFSDEIASLKKEIAKAKVDNEIQRVAFGMNLNEKAVNAMLKIQNFDDIYGQEANQEKIKEKIEAFLNDYEMFKPTSKSSGFKVEIGTSKEEPAKQTEEDAMRAAIGLIPKNKK